MFLYSTNSITQLMANVAKDGPSLAAAMSAASSGGPQSYESAVLQAVLDATDLSCPIEVVQLALHGFVFFGRRLCTYLKYTLLRKCCISNTGTPQLTERYAVSRTLVVPFAFLPSFGVSWEHP